MEVHTPLIAILVTGLVLAFIFGALAKALRLSPLLGYLLAGIAIGPFTPGLVPDAGLGAELAEIGIVLLMFGLGLEVSLRELLRVRAVALFGALVQIGLAGALGLGLALTQGWRLEAGLVLGLALSVTSGVALLGSFKARGLIATEPGRIATGWLVVENAVMVLALVLLPALAGFFGVGAAAGAHDPFASLLARLTGAETGAAGLAGLALVKLVAFAGFMLVVGRLVIPLMLDLAARLGARELFRLGVFAIALAIALGVSALFGVPLGLGAFLAGMILAENPPSRRAAEEGLPLREAFPALFFVALGMLFDPMAALADPLPLLAALAIVLIVRPVLAYGVLALFRRGRETAGTVAGGLAQIGEFSFILAGMALGLGLLPPEGRDVILATMLLSLALNPLVVLAFGKPAPAPEAEDGGAAGPSGHAVLIGHGRVGEAVAAGLRARGHDVLVVEDREPAAEAARARGLETVSGNAADPKTLARAGIGAARLLVLAMSDGFAAGQTVRAARRRNPALTILARAHSEAERAHLMALGADHVVTGADEIARALLEGVGGPQEGAAGTAALVAAASAAADPAPTPPAMAEPEEEDAAPAEAPAVEIFPGNEAAAPREPLTGTETEEDGPDAVRPAGTAPAPIVAHIESAAGMEAPPVLLGMPDGSGEAVTPAADAEESGAGVEEGVLGPVSLEPVQPAAEDAPDEAGAQEDAASAPGMAEPAQDTGEQPVAADAPGEGGASGEADARAETDTPDETGMSGGRDASPVADASDEADTPAAPDDADVSGGRDASPVAGASDEGDAPGEADGGDAQDPDGPPSGPRG